MSIGVESATRAYIKLFCILMLPGSGYLNVFPQAEGVKM